MKMPLGGPEKTQDTVDLGKEANKEAEKLDDNDAANVTFNVEDLINVESADDPGKTEKTDSEQATELLTKFFAGNIPAHLQEKLKGNVEYKKQGSELYDQSIKLDGGTITFVDGSETSTGMLPENYIRISDSHGGGSFIDKTGNSYTSDGLAYDNAGNLMFKGDGPANTDNEEYNKWLKQNQTRYNNIQTKANRNR